jgi:hypothetical protein
MKRRTKDRGDELDGVEGTPRKRRTPVRELNARKGDDADVAAVWSLSGGISEQPSASVAETKSGSILTVSDRFVNVAPLNEHLCLFSCLFNTLRDSRSRLAFSAGNIQNPPEEFKRLSREGYIKAKKDPSVKLRAGYNAEDVGRYLRFLVGMKLVKTWTWNRLNNFKLNKLLIDGNSRWKSPQTIALFGYSVPTDEVVKIKNRLKTFRKRLEQDPETRRIIKHDSEHIEKRMIDFYDKEIPHLSREYRKPAYEHGICLSIEHDGSVWLYDNGLVLRKRVRKVEDVATRLMTYWHAFVFKMETT